MQVVNWKDVEDVKIDKFPFKGEMHDVIGTSVRWLSKSGDDGHGYSRVLVCACSPSNPAARFRSTTIFIIKPCSSWKASSSVTPMTTKPRK